MQPSDLSGKQYSGRSFKGQDLAGADFQNADIRSADFRDANLLGATFMGAKAGLQNHWQIVHTIAFSSSAGFSSFISTLACFWLAVQLTIDAARLPTSVLFFVIGLAIFLAISLYKELLVAIGLSPLIVTVLMFLAGILTVSGSGHPTAGGAGAATAAVAIAGAVAITISLTSAHIAAGLWSSTMVTITSVLAMGLGIQQGQAGGTAAVLDITSKTSTLQVGTGVQMAVIAAIAILLLTVYLVWRTFVNDRRYDFIQDVAIALASIGGTRFCGSNLTDANFSHALLRNTDFRRATLTRSCWHQVRKLNWARVGDSVLATAHIRELLVSGDGCQKSYINANLQGANLMAANLHTANLKGADLSQATLRDACLDWANLTQTQAIGTDFSHAQMTGAGGLGTWNIDSSTQLDQVDCRWVYLLEHPKPGTDDRERRPSSGEFASEEFTHLFREVLDTVDLIFRNGIDWRAFTRSLQQVQVEHPLSQLDIQSIENKGDGIVVVKVRAQPDTDKSVVHTQFLQFYGDALVLLNQQAEALKQHDQELQSIRSVLGHLAPRATSHSMVVILNIGKGSFEMGFPVTLQILQEETALPSVQCIGELLPNLHIDQHYRDWQSAYRRSLNVSRLEVPSQVTNVSSAEFFAECIEAADRLTTAMNHWLESEPFRPIEQALQMRLSCDQPIRVILQTDHAQLRQLPWQTWRFFEHYPQAEVALSKLVYRSPILIVRADINPQVRILAIFGDGRGIDLEQDRLALTTLNADVTFLVERKRHELSDVLWNQSWDILFFAGHSSSHADRLTGDMFINSEQRLPIADLKSALTHAIGRGLKLAIFNSCDGLGLANVIADLQIPQMIIMREPVPDYVAHAFLMHFLTRFSQGQSFYQSVREARQQLQDLEDQYPCADWLPMIVQNPAEIPPTWQTLKTA